MSGRLGGPVAVAGGFGFLGRNLVEALKARGYEALAFSRQTGVDIRELNQVSDYLRSQRPAVVINCAANAGGIAYNALKPLEVYEDNLRIGFNLLEASLNAGVKKFVNILPNCTYPGRAKTYKESEWWDGPIDETALVNGMPRKALWVQAWAAKRKMGFNSIHLVLANLYGPGDHFDPIMSHALGALVQKIVDAKAKGNRTIEIWGTGKPVREWMHVRDAAHAIVLAMEKYGDIEIMNVGQGDGCTILDLAIMIKRAAGWGGEFTFDTSRPDGAARKVLDVAKMRKVLGWSPPTDLERGVVETTQWFAAHSGGRA